MRLVSCIALAMGLFLGLFPDAGGDGPADRRVGGAHPAARSRLSGGLEGHRLVFVVGLHRSGTTPLARLLAAHPEVSGFSDTGVPADEGQHLQSLYPVRKTPGEPGTFGFDPAYHMTEKHPLVSEESAHRLFEEWSPHWDLARPVLLEKSPPHLLKARFLQALFPSCTFVVIVRHPIPVTLATAKWRRTRGYHRLLEHWLRCHELFRSDSEQLERIHLVRYEELVRKPEPVVRGIFEFLGLEPVPAGDPLKAGADERYFRQWQELQRNPRIRAYLTAASLRYERRTRAFGYSLLRPQSRLVAELTLGRFAHRAQHTV